MPFWGPPSRGGFFDHLPWPCVISACSRAVASASRCTYPVSVYNLAQHAAWILSMRARARCNLRWITALDARAQRNPRGVPRVPPHCHCSSLPCLGVSGPSWGVGGSSHGLERRLGRPEATRRIAAWNVASIHTLRVTRLVQNSWAGMGRGRRTLGLVGGEVRIPLGR